jgi:hypothetical protein
VRALRDLKLRRTYCPSSGPERARELRIPGVMGRYRRGTHIWSRDATRAVVTRTKQRGLGHYVGRTESTADTAGCGEIPRTEFQSENRKIIPEDMATPWLADAGPGLITRRNGKPLVG